MVLAGKGRRLLFHSAMKKEGKTVVKIPYRNAANLPISLRSLDLLFYWCYFCTAGISGGVCHRTPLRFLFIRSSLDDWGGCAAFPDRMSRPSHLEVLLIFCNWIERCKCGRILQTSVVSGSGYPQSVRNIREAAAGVKTAFVESAPLLCGCVQLSVLRRKAKSKGWSYGKGKKNHWSYVKI